MDRPGSPSDWQALHAASRRFRQLDRAMVRTARQRDDLLRRLRDAGASHEQLAEVMGFGPLDVSIFLDLSERYRRWRDARAREHEKRLQAAQVEVREGLARGELDAVEPIRQRSLATESMVLDDLLRSQRGWGKARTARFLVALGLPRDVPIGKLEPDVQASVVERLQAATTPTV